jgi:mycothiol synthase
MIITTAAPGEWSAALDLALQHLSEDIRPARVLNALTLLAAGAIDPEGIFVARNAAGLCGVQICVPLPGASGLFWLPKTTPADARLEDRLVQRALDWLGGRGTKLAEALVSPRDVPYIRPLVRRGFRPVTRLHYLQHLLASVPPGSASRVRLITYAQENREVFHNTLLRTYEATLDCPELNGVRTIDEIIAGHIGQGNFRPERWWLAFEAERPVALAMVTEVPDTKAWDLSYLGVVPEARRRGLGRELARHVLDVAQSSRAPKVILAVDTRNQPALQLYSDLGFLSVDFREVYLYFWDRSLAAAPSKEIPGSSS